MRKMKDSGVEWIGEIPETWLIKRIKYLADYGMVNSFVDGDWIESPYIVDEGIRYLTTGNIGDGKFKEQGNGYISEDTFNELNCKYAYPGDFVISRLNAPYGRACILPNIKDKYVLAVDIVNLRTKEDKRYLCYLSQCAGYQRSVEDMARGTAMKRISRNNLGSINLPIPSIAEQQDIANYLDIYCAKVDSLIENVQKQIEKLNDYKQSLITEVVTKGLDINAPMKDSEVEWIGQINSNYSMNTIRSLFRIKKDIIGHEPDVVLSITQKGLKVKNINENEGQMASSYANYQIVKVGDFAMNHMDLITGGIGIADIEGVTSPDYRVFVKRDSELCSKYFLYVFESYYKNKIFYAFGQGAANVGRWRLPAKNFNTIKIPCPPIEEQYLIAKYLDHKCEQIEKLIMIKQAKIEKLEQYKKSLIYEYVTGKKEVQ